MPRSRPRPPIRGSVERVAKEEFIVGYQQRISCMLCLLVGLFTLPFLTAILIYLGKMESHLPLIVGLVLLIAGVGLAFAFSNHTALQSQIIAALVSLGGSAVATEGITGALNVNLTLGAKTAITASGAFAIFVIMYFFRARWDRE